MMGSRITQTLIPTRAICLVRPADLQRHRRQNAFPTNKTSCSRNIRGFDSRYKFPRKNGFNLRLEECFAKFVNGVQLLGLA
jgi:hypothetical protein